MKEGFRQSQAWLHTWTGLLLGWLLFAIFLTGSVSYFQDEITHWMHPERHHLRHAQLDLDKVLAQMQILAPDSKSWFLGLPDERQNTVRAFWQGGGEGGRRFESADLDPSSGARLDSLDTEGGNFFYRFHFQLWHVDALTGRYIVGFATMVMFVALITGVITHKKIFKDFFTFRPRKGQRSWLDGHNAAGVLALPFYLMITFTGLVIFAYLYMPWGIQVQYGKPGDFFGELYPQAVKVQPSGTPAPLPKLQPLLAQAGDGWQAARLSRVSIDNPGDANVHITLTESSDSIAGFGRTLVVGADGKLLQRIESPGGALLVNRFLVGLHLGHYAEPLLRWLYFFSGLLGAVMIASGLVLWVVKRAPQPDRNDETAKADFGLRLVRVLNVGAIAGLPIAMTAYLWANRLLPADLAGRRDWEIHAFFITWGLAFLHSTLRPHKRAWVEQFALGGAVLLGLPVLDALTGHDSLPYNLAHRDWLLAGFDLTCIGLGLGLAWLSWKVNRHQPARRSARVPKPARAAPTSAAVEHDAMELENAR
jgi:uncharacterized iron-regulated membrane protein